MTALVKTFPVDFLRGKCEERRGMSFDLQESFDIYIKIVGLRYSRFMETLITVGILNFKRAFNMKQIIGSIRSQTIKSEIFVWDNSGNFDQEEDVDWVVRSNRNEYCWPRWFMLASANTKYCMTLDDDMCLSKLSSLEIITKSLDESSFDEEIVGPEGVIMEEGAGYFPVYPPPFYRSRVPPGYRSSLHLLAGDIDRNVDVVKGRCMAMRTQALRSELPIVVGRDVVCDDIAVSAFLGNGKRCAHRVPARFKDIFIDLPGKDAEMSLSSKPEWIRTRNRAADYFFGTRNVDSDK